MARRLKSKQDPRKASETLKQVADAERPVREKLGLERIRWADDDPWHLAVLLEYIGCHAAALLRRGLLGSEAQISRSGTLDSVMSELETAGIDRDPIGERDSVHDLAMRTLVLHHIINRRLSALRINRVLTPGEYEEASDFEKGILIGIALQERYDQMVLVSRYERDIGIGQKQRRSGGTRYGRKKQDIDLDCVRAEVRRLIDESGLSKESAIVNIARRISRRGGADITAAALKQRLRRAGLYKNL